MPVETPILEPAAATTPPRKRSGVAFAATFLVAFFLVWLSAVTVHFVGNPDGLYPSRRNPSRRELAWKTRQLDRLLKQGKPPTGLVLGSSRMMQVSPQQVNLLTRAQTFNFAVPGASPVEMLAQLRWAIADGMKPTHVLIGLDDVAMFGGYEPTHAVRTLTSPGVFMHLPLPQKVSVALAGLAQIKPQLTSRAIKNAIDPPQFKRQRMDRLGTVIFGDGYIAYPRRTVGMSTGKYDQADELDAKLSLYRALGEKVHLYPNGARMSFDQMVALRQILRLCREKQIAATVVHTPVHPEYDRMTMRPRDLAARKSLADWVSRLCHREHARFMDATSLASFQADPREFWDHIHQTPHNMMRMINVAHGQAPEYRIDFVPTDKQRIEKPTHTNSSNTP